MILFNDEVKISFLLFSDDTVRLFLNIQKLKEQLVVMENGT